MLRCGHRSENLTHQSGYGRVNSCRLRMRRGADEPRGDRGASSRRAAPLTLSNGSHPDRKGPPPTASPRSHPFRPLCGRPAPLSHTTPRGGNPGRGHASTPGVPPRPVGAGRGPARTEVGQGPRTASYARPPAAPSDVGARGAEPGAAPRTVPLKLGSWRACPRAPLGTACTGGSARLGSAPGRSRTPHTGYGGPQEWNAGRERRANRRWEWTFRAPQWSGAGPTRFRRTPSTCARRSTGRRPRSRRSRSPSGAGRRRGSTGRGRGSRRRRTSAAPGRAGDCKRGRGRSTVTQCRFAGERSPRAGEPRACGLVVTARRSVEPDP